MVFKVRLSTRDELRKFLTKTKKIKKKKKKAIKLRRVKRSYSDWHRLLVVKLRYKDSSYSQLRFGWKEISEITGINSSTCLEMVKQFHANGNNEERRYSKGRLPFQLPA